MLIIVNTSYHKLPFGSGDYSTQISFVNNNDTCNISVKRGWMSMHTPPVNDTAIHGTYSIIHAGSGRTCVRGQIYNERMQNTTARHACGHRRRRY